MIKTKKILLKFVIIQVLMISYLLLFSSIGMITIQAKSFHPVKTIKIDQVYYNYMDNFYFKLIDKKNYSVIGFNGTPQNYFDDGELYFIDFYKGTYVKKGRNYWFSKQINDSTSIYFMDMKRLKKEQYSDIDAPHKEKISNIKLYRHQGKYYISGYKSNKLIDPYPLDKYRNHIKGVKNSTFPNNSQEFLQQFTYIPREKVNN